MARVKWLDRELVRSPLYYCLCTSEAEYLAEIKRLKITDPDRWLKRGSGAATHFLINDDGSTCALVCMEVKATRTMLEHECLLVHEAVHIFQDICAAWGEKHPSSEFQAYSIQRISLNLMDKFHRCLLTMDRKLINAINRISKERLA